MPTELPHMIPPKSKERSVVTFLSMYSRSDLGVSKEQKLINFEKWCEGQLIQVFKLLGIYALVKDNRYSLPYKGEVVHVLDGKTSLHPAYQFERVARVIVKRLVEEEVEKVRFYLYINFKEIDGEFRGIEYRFRYFVHA